MSRKEEREKFTSQNAKDKWGYWIALTAMLVWPVALVVQIVSSFF